MNIQSGDRISCTYAGLELEGFFITERDGKAVIKLDSGYNIGIDAGLMKKLETHAPKPPAPKKIEQDESLPPLSIVSTGGTIASRIDYRTGAVTSQFEAEDILRAIPGLAGIGRFSAQVPATILSENMTPAIWRKLASAVLEEIKDGARGVIVTHGTDTMAYSAAALSFMIDTPVPIVFVGSQRSADRPSSDNVMNGLCSAAAANSDLGEVSVVMHATTNDDYCAIHRGTRVRKMHTSRRDASASIGRDVIGTVDYPSLDVKLADSAVRRRDCEASMNDKLEEKVGILYFYPGMSPAVVEAFKGYRGIVIMGTGLGHISSECIPEVLSLVKDGTSVVMTSQCLNGRVCDRVYDTGRDLLKAGVIEGGDMLPEAAMVKLMWVLGNESDPERVAGLMQTDLRGELGRCTPNGL